MHELPAELEARRPTLPAALDIDRFEIDRVQGAGPPPRVLAVGVVLADQLNTAADTAARLDESRHYEVEQRWVVVDPRPGVPVAERPTAVLTTGERRPKYALVNEQLAEVDLARYEFVLLVDDDVIVPHCFVDAFLGVQSTVGFAIAQPSRTATSSIDHPIVARHPGLVARQTWFVEQGPIVSFHRSILADVAPFDLRSPMGWGYECVWSARVGARGLQMGIVDAVSVDHGVRPVLANYSITDSLEEQAALLAEVAHRPIDECMRVERVVMDLA
jgi:hypothetical protein